MNNADFTLVSKNKHVRFPSKPLDNADGSGTIYDSVQGVGPVHLPKYDNTKPFRVEPWTPELEQN